MSTKRNLNFEKINRVAKILKTISHPVRLEILQVLEVKEPLSVSTIKEKIRMDIEQSMLSHHLIKMSDKGILSSKKNGKNIFYRIQDRTILGVFNCIEACNAV